MKINFIGLSSFLFTSENGYTILTDPFSDAPEDQLGISFPTEIRPNLTLVSHNDPDHCNLRFKMVTAPAELNLTKIKSQEYNGDNFDILKFEIDSLKIVHFADQSTELTDEQLGAVGKIDIAICPAPKVDGQKMPQVLEITKDNIEKMNPNLVLWSHFITPKGWVDSSDRRNFFVEFFSKNARTNKNYIGKDTFVELYYSLQNAIHLNDYFGGKRIDGCIIELDSSKILSKSILFEQMLARPVA